MSDLSEIILDDLQAKVINKCAVEIMKLPPEKRAESVGTLAHLLFVGNSAEYLRYRKNAEQLAKK